MDKIFKKRKKFIIIILVLITTLLSSFILQDAISYQQEGYKSTKITFDGDYRLPNDDTLRPIDKGEKVNAIEYKSIQFEGHFDQEIGKSRTLFFLIRYLEVHIFVNNEEVYSFGTPDTYPSTVKSAGMCWGQWKLKDKITPQDQVKIVLKTRYDNNYNTAYYDLIENIFVGQKTSIIGQAWLKSWMFVLLDIFFLAISLIIFIFTFVLKRQKINVHPSIYRYSVFSIIISILLYLKTPFHIVITNHSVFTMQLESLFMFISLALSSFYFSTFMKQKTKKVMNVLSTFLVGCLLLYLILQVFGIVDGYEVRTLLIVLLAINTLVVVPCVIYEIIHGGYQTFRYFLLPGILFIICIVIETLNYPLEFCESSLFFSIGFYIYMSGQFLIALKYLTDAMFLAKQTVKLEKELLDSKISIMLSQIQPHFLYNSLLGIKQLTDTEPQKASIALDHFSYFLRSNLDSLSNANLIAFEKELNHVKDYLYLEKIRFEERLLIEWDIQYTDFLIPSLTLQPLIENAVRYGVTKKPGGGVVKISSYRNEHEIIISIIDDGVGFDIYERKDDGRTHIGIENVRNRLHIQCEGELIIKSEKGVGTNVKIILPLH